MSARLTDKVCVVTGASSGIGAAIATAFAAEGGKVLGLARRFAPAAIELRAGRVSEVGLDVSDEVAVDSGFAALDGIDILVNNAGVGSFAPFAETALADLRAMLDVHIVGTFLCCRAALRHMAEQRRGHIVNISSTAVHNSFPQCAGYTAAKMGQLGLGRVLREECRELDVRVTSLEPGAVDTPIWDGRPGFDRSKMIAAEQLAGLVVDIVTRPEISIDELLVVPPGGNL